MRDDLTTWDYYPKCSFKRLKEMALRADAALDVAILRLRSRLAADEVLTRLEILKKSFNPDQPRVPGGEPDGGQWTTGSAAGGASDPSEGRAASILHWSTTSSLSMSQHAAQALVRQNAMNSTSVTFSTAT
jgi:hypothetical protein